MIKATEQQIDAGARALFHRAKQDIWDELNYDQRSATYDDEVEQDPDMGTFLRDRAQIAIEAALNVVAQ